MPLHRSWAEEQTPTDLRVGEAIASEQRDVPLLRGQIVVRLHHAGRHRVPGRDECVAGAGGERLPADPAEQVGGGAESLAGIEAAILTPQPCAIHQMRPRELGPDGRPTESVDRLAIEALRRLAV